MDNTIFSIQAIHNQLNDIKHVVVCVNPVNLDNIWQSFWALVRVPNARIHITLSPRVLDLRVPNFAELFDELMAKMGSHYMLDILEKDAKEIYDLLGYVSSRYIFYWDPRSMETIIPGIHYLTNNYNDLMDLGAAMEIENIVKKRAIPIWFFLTECAKAKVKGGMVLCVCPWDFVTEELVTIFKAAGDMKSYEQADAFTRETMTLAKMYMFDVLTVVPFTLPSSLPYRRAVSYWGEVNG
ncbi:hypothetical protein DL762_004408 [Monosporascus cannonballus]|uniref:Uncharacterized protein n=1 Tax=Monosporascus cannonballus TaxID=155416 RepID=A0ABY0H8F2_9PEZI|nr:hypothetical protein DL762_004408 [Monosporascus cannonballus]